MGSMAILESPIFQDSASIDWNQNTQQQATEVLILVTPRMVRLAPHKDHVIYAGQGSLEGTTGAAAPPPPAAPPAPPPVAPPGQEPPAGEEPPAGQAPPDEAPGQTPPPLPGVRRESRRTNRWQFRPNSNARFMNRS